MANTAQKVREHKDKHPELYCSKCFWKTGGGNCPRHPITAAIAETAERLPNKARTEEEAALTRQTTTFYAI